MQLGIFGLRRMGASMAQRLAPVVPDAPIADDGIWHNPESVN